MPDNDRDDSGNLRALSHYQYDVFISYSKLDELTARQLYTALIRRNLKPFFALFDLNDEDEIIDNQWVGILRQALGQSCHYAGLITPHFLATPWCGLELRGFDNLRKSNPERGMLLFPIGVDIDQLGAGFKPSFFLGDFEAFQESLAAIASSGSLRVDDPIHPFPPRLFRPLPLREKYGLVAPWGKDSETPGGHPAGAPFAAYEECVREVMVQILRGAAAEKVMEGIHGWPWQGINFKDVHGDALEFLATGVSPFA